MYRVEFEGRAIGETLLESADAPMGVVMGKVRLSIAGSAYEFFRELCVKSNIQINDEDADVGLIDTQNIPQLRVLREDGVAIEGFPGAAITGMLDDGYYITIVGIPYPFYGEEFPHHCKAYAEAYSSVGREESERHNKPAISSPIPPRVD